MDIVSTQKILCDPKKISLSLSSKSPPSQLGRCKDRLQAMPINSLFEISRAGLRLLVNNMISSMSEFVQNFQEELYSTVHGALPCSAVVVKPLLGNGAC